MITIDGEEYLADRVIEVTQEHTVPMQRTEKGFSVQDHIESVPLKLEMEIILFDGGDNVTRKQTYANLQSVYDDKQLVKIDCTGEDNDYARDDMIYENMAMTHLSRAVQRGNVYYCIVLFTEITKTAIETAQIFVQEVDAVVDDEGNETSAATIRWSKDAFEPTTVETPTIVDQGSEGTLVLGTSGFYRTGRVITPVDTEDNPPSCHALSPTGEKVTSKNLLEDVWDWASGVKAGLRGCLSFMVEA
jgi:hypothetical protein